MAFLYLLNNDQVVNKCNSYFILKYVLCVSKCLIHKNCFDNNFLMTVER